MSASQIRGQLERKAKQRLDAERKAGEYRAKESSNRSEAAKARGKAAKAPSASMAASRIREAERHDRSAESASKDFARWQKRAAGYAKEENALSGRLAKEEQREREAQERARVREQRLAEQRSAASDRRIHERLDDTDRRLETALRQMPEPQPEKLRILLLGSSSAGDLRVGREQKRIRAAVQAALHRDHVELDVRPAATTADLLDGVTAFRPHIVHFSGHSAEDLIVFEDEVDEPHDGAIASARAFVVAIAATDTPPTLVLLNSCDSAGQAEALIEQVVPFAIGMASEIDDGSAISYAAQFYAAVANGQSVWAAHQSGRAALELAGLDGAELPTLAAADDVDSREAILVTGTMPSVN